MDCTICNDRIFLIELRNVQSTSLKSNIPKLRIVQSTIFFFLYLQHYGMYNPQLLKFFQ